MLHYPALQHEWFGNEGEGCVFAGSLAPSPRQAVEEMIASRMENSEMRRLRQGSLGTGLERFC